MIKGELGPVSVPGLFRTIADEHRTGLLTVSSVGGHDGFVYFREGDLYHARLQPARVQLGPRLVSAGLVSTEEIEQALLTQKSVKGAPWMGELLVSIGLLQRSQLKAVVKEEIEDAIFEILNWHSGTFSFEPDELTDEDVGAEFTVDSLVSEGESRLREWNEISNHVPTFDAVPEFTEVDGASEDVALRPEEWSFISRLDGRLSISQLAQACGFTHLEAGRCIFGLVSTGLLKLVEPEDSDDFIEEREIEAAVLELQQSLGANGQQVSLEEMVLAGGGTVDRLDAAALEEPEPEPEAEAAEPAEEASVAVEVEKRPPEQPNELLPESEAETAVAEPEPEQVEPDPEPQVAGPRITMPAFTYDVLSTHSYLDGESGIVAEELVDGKDSMNKVLAELARPADDDEFIAVLKTNGELIESVEEQRPESAGVQPQFSDLRPVDPLVDTTALIRELASYSSSEEEPASEPPIFPEPDEAPPRKGGKAGRFGRKKKR